MQTSERSSAMKSLSVVTSDHNYLKSLAATSSLLGCELLSMNAQMWECRARYAPHIAESLERTIQRCNNYIVENVANEVYLVTKAGFIGRAELGNTQFKVSYNGLANRYECTEGCNKAIYKGKPCVHMVKVFQHLGQPLFQAAYIHDHWLISKNWNFDTIKNRCIQRDPIDEIVAEDNHDDNNDDDFNDGDDPASDAFKRQSSVAQLQEHYTRSANVVVLSKNRYVFAKKLFDQVASYFPNKDIFNGFVDVVRSVLITCSSTDISEGMNRIKAYVTVDPRLQKPVENSTTLLPVARKKEGRGKTSTRGKMVRS